MLKQFQSQTSNQGRKNDAGCNTAFSINVSHSSSSWHEQPGP